jgi:hypothetical protein
MSISLGIRSAAAAAVLGLALAMPAPARADVEVGLLRCHSPGMTGFIVVSARQFSCVFTPSYGGPGQYYQATIYRFGAQIGFSNEVGLAWVVTSATRRVGPGSLAGSYGGASAGAAVLVGGRASALFGGLDNAFALQPVNFEGETGLNAVATVTGLQLQPVMPVRPVRRHRR